MIQEPVALVENKVPRDAIEEFASLVQSGIDSWTKAGELLVAMVNVDPGIYGKIRRAHPSITQHMLYAFERIGMKKVYAPLLADTTVAGRALMELPFESQQKFFHTPIEVVTSIRGGITKTKHKRLDELTRDEVRMVFGKGCIHTVDQQAFRFREIQAAEIQKEKPRPAFVDYKTVEVGYYIITMGQDGEPKIKKSPAVMPNAVSVRLTPYTEGEKAAVVLFYRTPRE